MYHSPLREDRNASFCVSTKKNLWFDFGTSQGGNVIDLAIALKGYCPFSEAVTWLEEQVACFRSDALYKDISRFEDTHMSKMSGNANISGVSTVDLSDRRLFEYLESRGIPGDIGKRYCKEVHYKVRDREYFGLCFMNILGGMEIRSRFFKGCHGVKAPTIISVGKESRTSACCVFEGFMDFLSYLVLQERKDKEVVLDFPCDCIIMNSTSIIQRVIPFIGVYRHAFSFLDNDFAGKQAYDTIDLVMPGRILSKSGKFYPYNDLNDYLVSLP